MGFKDRFLLAKKIIMSPERRWVALSRTQIGHMIPDQTYLSRFFYLRMGYRLNFDNPESFNEKINWLKLNDHNPIYKTMVDKYMAKEYVAKIIGDEYVVPLIGVWDRYSDIDFQHFPDRFVLKTTHDSGGVVVIRDKKSFDKAKAEKKINKSLGRNYYWFGREWPYKNIRPRIIAEEYLGDISRRKHSNEMDEWVDYKLMCFNGKVRCSFVCTERSSGSLKVTFYDSDWKELPFERHYPKSACHIPKPKSYIEMVEIAEKLSDGFPFMRIDFYEVAGRPIVGEITLYPGSGFEEFNPIEWDYKLGRWIDLSVVRYSMR